MTTLLTSASSPAVTSLPPGIWPDGGTGAGTTPRPGNLSGALDDVRRSLNRTGAAISARLAGQGWTALAYLSAVVLLADWALQQHTALAGLSWLLNADHAQAPWYHLAAVIDHAVPMPAVDLLGWLTVLAAIDSPPIMQQVHRGLRGRSGLVSERLGDGPLAGLSWAAGLNPGEVLAHTEADAVDASTLQTLAALRGHRVPAWPRLSRLVTAVPSGALLVGS